MDTLVNRGWAHYKSGSMEAAVQDFRTAAQEDGSNYTARLNLGVVLYEQGDTVEAVREFEQVVGMTERRTRHQSQHP